MTKQQHIIIRLDAHHKIGLAHAVRVKNILSQLHSPLNPVVMGFGDQLKPLFGNLSKVIEFKTEDECENTTAVLDYAQTQKIEYILIDQPHLSRVSYDMFDQSALKSIVIDDEGNIPSGDVIINGTVLDQYHHYPHMKDQKNIYVGGQYALINPIFAAHPWQVKGANNLAIVIGGGARAQNWALWLLSDEGPIKGLQNLTTTMIVGASFKYFDHLKKEATGHNIILHQALPQPELVKCLGGTDIALMTGGMIVYEALAMGVPALVYPQEANLPPEAMWLNEQGAVINLGQKNALDEVFLRSKLEQLIADTEAQKAMSQKGKSLIDGRGVERVVGVIDAFLTIKGRGK